MAGIIPWRKRSVLIAMVLAMAVSACGLQPGKSMETGIRLEFDDRRTSLTGVSEIQSALKKVGLGVWPIELEKAPQAIRKLLDQPILSDQEKTRVRDHFLLSRTRLLEVISLSGRTPNVPDGGALETFVSNEGYSYPQLWLVQRGDDYTRFDRFHVNVAKDGTGVDEVMQLVSGKGVVVRVRNPDGMVHSLTLDTLGNRFGWMVSYNGGAAHIGSLSNATPGAKVVMQVIGPKSFELRYLDEAK